MTLVRVRDWRTRLLGWAESKRGQEYLWGATDCGTLAREALGVLFGQDVMPKIPRWRTARAAAKVLRWYGPPERILRQLGARPCGLSFAQAGDIVLASEPAELIGRRTFMVCVGGRLLLTSGFEGVRFIARDDLSRDAVAYSLIEAHLDG